MVSEQEWLKQIFEPPQVEYLFKRRQELQNQGFVYERGIFEEEGHVFSPTGNYYDFLTCEHILNRKLIINNWRHIEVLKSLELLYLYDDPESLLNPKLKATLV